MPNTKEFHQVNSVYIRSEVWRWLREEAIRNNTYVRDITSIALTAYMKWMKKAEIADRKARKQNTEEVEQQLAEVQASLDHQMKNMAKREKVILLKDENGGKGRTDNLRPATPIKVVTPRK